MEVQNADEFFEDLLALNLDSKYEGVKLSLVLQQDWGRECYLHDPSGVLWHFGEFNKTQDSN
ncbi:MAG: hypothetical protein WBJ10_05415 [Daejeonella sp.]|uniref:hypothetical protein n=1 Tax=Daejeonella sp. TaxID=2805397 RepID=UPI003C7337A5